MDGLHLDILKITGDVSIELVPSTMKVTTDAHIYLLLGPTGAGKSSFIEALADESQNLSISKDQLSGYTQSVTAYKLVNIWRSFPPMDNYPVYLVDTPGFSDTKLSEMEIMDMVRKWMAHNERSFVNRAFFLTPITDTRLAGSKRRTIKMIQSFLKPSYDLTSISFITTMWDTLHNDYILTFFLQDLIDEGAKLGKFTNTYKSAIDSLDGRTILGDSYLTSPPTGSSYIYQDLHDRIMGALQQKKTIESELSDPQTRAIFELQSILERNHKENEGLLTKFIKQLSQFSHPPAGFEDAHHRLQGAISTTTRATLFDTKPDDVYSPWDDLYFGLMERRETRAYQSREITELRHDPTIHAITSTTYERHPAGSNDSFPQTSPVVQRLPTRIDTLHSGGMLAPRGLFHRLIQKGKRLGNK